MHQLSILRLEINYFLTFIESTLGIDDKSLAEEAIDLLINFYLFNYNKEFCKDYIERLEMYIEQISKVESLEFKLLKKNIPHIINLITTIKYELKN